MARNHLPGAGVLLAAVLGLTACGGNPPAATGPETNERETSSAMTRNEAGEGPAVELFRKYIDAINGGDLDGYLALFAEDAVFVDAGRRMTGIAQIRRWGADLIEVDSKYVIVELTGEGNEARLVFDYEAPGVGYSLDDGAGELTANDSGQISSLRLD